MSKTEEQIIKRYRIIKNISIAAMAIDFFIVPIILILMYVDNSFINGLKDMFAIVILFLVAITAISTFLSRICPNCGAYFGKYSIYPSRCKSCNAKLR